MWVVTARTPDGFYRWSGENPEDAAQWIGRISETLPAGETLWFVQVQGVADEAVENPEQFRTHVERRSAGAVPVESYSDGNTHSLAYAAPEFAPFPDAAISLQAAAHLDTESGRWRLTLGTPVILTEF